ncbi:probable carboxylesterase Os04g0669600 [Miscanthus floridulus]|uniref:probable carboxylesterase Os04g0669600 n=1 Tax=Miscanthus floridulus TaxID=154761 RepID=UPI003457A929
MAAAAERPSAGGFVLCLHGSGGSGDERGAQVAPYFSAPDTASSVRLSFPTAPTASIPLLRQRSSCGNESVRHFLLWDEPRSGSVPLNKSFAEKVSSDARKAYPTLGHSMVDEELQYFQQWILNCLGMTVSGATETARPSSSSNHTDPQ